MVAADTAWIIVATALVLFMTLPGLALFYGGLVRSRNVLSVFMHCYAIACLMSILWLAVGYSIAFGEGNAIWGGLGKAFLNGVTAESLSGTLPEVLFFAFQMTFNHHPGADRRGLCRAHRFWFRADLFGGLDAAVLRAGGALDLGWRDAGRWRHFRRNRRAGFCRRHRGA